MRENTPGILFSEILKKGNPEAIAWIKGNTEYPKLRGVVKFYATPYIGILIEAEIFGLPNQGSSESSSYHAMHIHENGNCTEPFDRTGEHYSRNTAVHPAHTGDMLPILGNNGYAWITFYDSRLTILEILGRSVILHEKPDDFTTQPSGNAGAKIGCGIIQKI